MFLYIAAKSSLIGKMARWALLLQEFEFDVINRRGAQHAIADYLSRLESSDGVWNSARPQPRLKHLMKEQKRNGGSYTYTEETTQDVYVENP